MNKKDYQKMLKIIKGESDRHLSSYKESKRYMKPKQAASARERMDGIAGVQVELIDAFYEDGYESE